MTLPDIAALRRRISILFRDDPEAGRVTRVFNLALATLIILSVTGVVLESVESVGTRYEAALWWLEWVATVLFSIEYLLRLWTAVDLGETRFAAPLWGRLRYAASFSSVIDLMAILPALLGLIGAADLRVLRLLRLLRMLKLTRHAMVFGLLWAVFREEARAISALLFILLLTLITSGALMYMIEGEAQPTLFSSIPAAMWWAVETLTTVGYGDIVPVTPLGRILGGIVSIVGVAALALFTGLITVSFMEQLKLRRVLLQQAMDMRRAEGPLGGNDIRTFARIGARLGLPETEIAEAVLHALAEDTMLSCPHCGHAIHGIAGKPKATSEGAGR